jgi:hypothetical protein
MFNTPVDTRCFPGICAASPGEPGVLDDSPFYLILNGESIKGLILNLGRKWIKSAARSGSALAAPHTLCFRQNEVD